MIESGSDERINDQDFSNFSLPFRPLTLDYLLCFIELVLLTIEMLLHSIRPLLRPSSSTQRFLSTCSTSLSSIPPLIGSAPYYTRHLVIHTPHSSKTWPSHLESTSQLYSHLSKRWSKLQGFKELGFAFSEEGGDLGDKVEKEWDPMRNRFESPLQTSTPE